MKLVAILMVRNESRIIERCMQALVGVVDAFCVHDTGSTDNTRDLVKAFLEEKKGCITESEWKNFGHNRTISFQAARDYVRDGLKWDLATTYGLLLDADMVFVPGKLREQNLTEPGYSVIQCAGSLEYPNCRLVRMDYEWKCLGVTHEYWDGPTTRLAKDICYIDDRNDGGCKSDKFERDARLLEEGLKQDPINVRYMFYLAQTYHSLRRWKDSIMMYKLRIVSGGWEEEVWYSHYMIGQCYLALENPEKFEAWMLKAFKNRPSRAEPLYKLAKYFREHSQHYKAYHYAKLGRSIPYSNDSLFVEKDVYNKLFDYEMTILHYYVSSDRTDGLRKTTDYLLQTNDSRVFANMVFYVTPIGKGIPLQIDSKLFGSDYHPGSVCMWTQNGQVHMNIRYVNYRLDSKTRNTYEMCENGVYSTSNIVRTQNAHYSNNVFTCMNDATITLPRKDKHIRGLEDVRVFKRDGELWFTATSLEFSDNIRILYGRYHPTGTYSDCRVLDSPTNQPCEKNWLGVSDTNDMIYRWFPLEVGSAVENRLQIHTSHNTPIFFERMRGSAPPIHIDSELWVMTHMVEYSVPRKYYHMFVILDPKTYKPNRMSLPFVFEEATVEYCLGIIVGDNGIECVYSSMDDNPKVTTIPFNRLHWVSL